MSTSETESAVQEATRAEIRSRLHAAIPGGAHTNAKADDQYPAEAPVAIARGQGCRVWDVEGNVFVEYGSGLRSVTLGHAYPRVVEAAERALADGANFLRPSLLEARVRGAAPRPDRGRGHGQVHEGRLDGDDRRAQACPCVHGSRPRCDLRGTLLLRRRLAHDDDGRSMQASHGRWRTSRLRSATTTCRASSVSSRSIRLDRVRLLGAGANRTSSRRLPSERARSLCPGRCVARLRRDDHRLSVAQQWRTSRRTRSRPISRRSARGWPTASRSPRWSESATS